MWKHEIIDYLNTFDNSTGVKPIHATECFYLGEITSYGDMTLDRTIVQLPYENILIEWHIPRSISTDVSRQATFVVNTTADIVYEQECMFNCGIKQAVDTTADAVQAYVFKYSIKQKEWCIVPCSVAWLKDGSYMQTCEMQFKDGSHKYNKIPSDELTVYANGVRDIVFTLTNLLSCKNITTDTTDPPERVNKKRLKNGKTPLFRYHILTVDISKGRKLANKSPIQNIGIMPVHLCRGHFKEYTEEKPLFGRVTGRFWWQPFARGDAKNGIIDKDYNIKKGE